MSSVGPGRYSNILASDPTPTFTPLDLRSTHGLKVSSIRRFLCRRVRRLLLVTTDRAIAGAPSILNYLRTVAARHGIDKHIKFHHEVLSMDWRSDEQKWKIEALVNKTEKKTFWARFIVMGTGYYDYNEVSRKRHGRPNSSFHMALYFPENTLPLMHPQSLALFTVLTMSPPLASPNQNPGHREF
jgi:hypothetical protein